jgi:hypothetical protein
MQIVLFLYCEDLYAELDMFRWSLRSVCSIPPIIWCVSPMKDTVILRDKDSFRDNLLFKHLKNPFPE